MRNHVVTRTTCDAGGCAESANCPHSDIPGEEMETPTTGTSSNPHAQATQNAAAESKSAQDDGMVRPKFELGRELETTRSASSPIRGMAGGGFEPDTSIFSGGPMQLRRAAYAWKLGRWRDSESNRGHYSSWLSLPIPLSQRTKRSTHRGCGCGLGSRPSTSPSAG
jgi:hypothetical protein